MQDHGPVYLGKVREEKFRCLLTLTQRLEVEYFRHLDLLEYTATPVLAKRSRISNRECVGTLDSDTARLDAIQLRHALHLGECDIIAILQAVALLIDRRDQAFLIVRDRHNHTIQWLLAVGILAHEVGAKVIKNRTEQATHIGCNKVCRSVMCQVVHAQLFIQWCMCQYNDLE